MLRFHTDPPYPVELLQFSSAGDILAVWTHFAPLTLRDPHTFEVLKRGTESSTGVPLFWCGPSRRCLVVRARRGRELPDTTLPTEDAPSILPVQVHRDSVFSRSGQRGVSVSGWSTESVFVGWQVKDNRFHQMWESTPRPYLYQFNQVRGFLADDTKFAFTCRDANAFSEQLLGVANADDGRGLTTVRIGTVSVGNVEASPDGIWLAVAPSNGTLIELYRASDLESKPVVLKNLSPSKITAIAFHPSSCYLTSATDKTITFYDTATWKVAKTFDWKIGKLRCVAFSPDGALAAVGSDTGQVVVWDIDV